MTTPLPIKYRALFALTATLLLATPLGAQERPSVADLDQLLESAARGESIGGARMLDALRKTGPDAVETLFTALERGDGGSPVQVQSILTTLRELPSIVARRLAELDASAERIELASIALQVMARIRTPDEVAVALEVAAPHPSVPRREQRPVNRLFVETFATILGRDRAAYSHCDRVFGKLPGLQQMAVLEAAGSVPSVDSLRFLATLLGRAPDLDGVALTQLGLSAVGVEAPLEDAKLIRVRPYLQHANVSVRRQAAQAVGRLDDFGSVESLIRLLEDEQLGVREMAHWSLKEITAMTLSSEPKRWRSWFEQENRWWNDEAQAVLNRMQGTHLPDVLAAINELAGKRLFRHPLTTELLPLLHDSDPRIVRMTCSALLSLRARGVERPLIELLDAADPSVRQHAWRTVKRLTGRDLPPIVETWRAEFPR